MEVTGKEYQKMSKKASPPSPIVKDCIFAFLVGGLLCTAGQLIVMACVSAGLDEKNARLVCSLSLIALSMLLTGLNVFDDVARVAGAGTLVPITGFANAIAAPAIEFKSEGLVLGMAAKMFSIAGPVLVYGISASVLYGLILCLLSAF